VYSFYKYSDIEPLLLTKHTPLGYLVYRGLAKLTFKPFMEHFLSHSDREVYLIGVDESVTSGYSHVALLTSVTQYVIHNGLIATNRVKYSGKSLDFRLNNPRNFHYMGVPNIDVILVDDIVTTGTTLLEAKEVLEENGVNLLFGLTLADVLE